jgi:hypothetical protein
MRCKNNQLCFIKQIARIDQWLNMKMLDFSHIINVLHFFFLFNFYLKKLNFLHSLYNAELTEISVSATQTFMREKGF